MDEKPLELPIKKPPRQRVQVKTFKDPRYNPSCSGSSDNRHFVRNYAFINDIRQQELQELRKALRIEKDPEKKSNLKMAISRFNNKINDLSEKQNRKNGPRPDKKMEIVERFKELKQSGKLTRYLERKRKKNLKRDEKSFS